MPRAPRDAEIERLRRTIDELDQSLLDILNERLEVARQIGARKASQGAPVFVAPREKQVLQGLLRRNQGPFPKESLLRIYREVFAASRRAETPIRVSFAGAPGSLCHGAASALFGETTRLEGQPSSTECLARVSRKDSDYAVLPSVVAPEGVGEFALLHVLRFQLYLVAEFHLPLDVGIALPPRRKAARVVLIPPAFSDLAAERLPGILPGVRLEVAADLATAARRAREQPGTGALVPQFTAEAAGLVLRTPVLGPGEGRRVRYLVAAREPATATGSDKTTVAFGLVNQAGNLTRALQPFARRRINVHLLTASPATGSWSREDLFFLEFEGHFETDRSRKTLEELKKVCSFVEVLGSYPVFDLESRSL